MLAIRVDEQIDLRLLSERDLDAHFALLTANQAFISVWEPWVNAITYAGQLDYVRYMQDQYANGIAFTCGVWYRECVDCLHDLVGNVTYRTSRDIRSVELGYWLAEDYTGQGIITRAVGALLRYAFETDKLNRALIRAAADNTASRAVAERLGFHLDGLLRGDMRLHNRTVDRVIYTMMMTDWEAMQARQQTEHN